MSRYLTKLCDQLVCLLSAEHSQTIVWRDEDEDPDDASVGAENNDSDRLYDFTVTKTNEQEENVVVRQGFTVQCPVTDASLRINLSRRSSKDELLASCQPTPATQNGHRPNCLVS